AKDPADRYQSALEFREALEAAARAEGVALPVLGAPAGAAGPVGSTTIVDQFAVPPTVVDQPVLPPTVVDQPAAAAMQDPSATIVQGSAATAAAAAAAAAMANGNAEDVTRIEQPVAPEVNSRDVTVAAGMSPFATDRQPTPPEVTKRPPRGRALVVAAIVAAVVLIGGGIAAAVMLSGSSSDTKVSAGGGNGKRVPGADLTPPPLAITTANPSIVGYGKGQQVVVGTSEPGAQVSQVGGDATTADASGNWQLGIIVSQVGANTFQFVAKDKAGNESAVQSITFYQQEPPTVATTAPRRSGGSSGGGGGSGGKSGGGTAPSQAPQVSSANSSNPTTGAAPVVQNAPPSLSQLADQCHALDFGACDSLYQQSDPGSAYEEYGGTCGNATSNGIAIGHVDGQCAYFGNLATQCYNGNFNSCDTLYYQTPSGGGWENYGMTCGGRVGANDGGYCEDWHNAGYI
ncbi:MAG: hypothetical protein ACXWAY_06155, partial [Acidimicrobiia bacterium]